MDGAGSFTPGHAPVASTDQVLVPPVNPGTADRPTTTPRWCQWTSPGVTLPIVVAVLAVALVYVLVDRGERGPGLGEAIVEVSGVARVERAGHDDAETVTGRTRLEPGDSFDLRSGTAHFEAAEGVVYEAKGPAPQLGGTSLVMAVAPLLRSGRLLVETAGASASVRAGSAYVKVEPRSAARLARSYAVGMGVYRGSAQLSSAGRLRRVGSFRSAEEAGPGEIGSARPLDYGASDRWDRRFLSDAIYLDGQLAPLLKGIEASQISALSFVDAVRKQLPHPPSAGEVARLVGLAPIRLDLGIALAVVGTADHGLTRYWQRAVVDRKEAMPWGLVAMDLRTDPADVIAVLGRALDSRALAGLPGLAGTRAVALGDPAGTPGAVVPPVAATQATGSVVGIANPVFPGTSPPANQGPTGAGPPISPAPSASPGPGAPNSNATPGAGGGGSTTGSGTSSGGTTATVGPGVTVTVTLPPVILPPVTLPPVTVPTVTVPRITVPATTVPATTVPATTVPTVTVPRITVPAIPAPTVTVPALAVPPANDPLGGVTGLLGP